jgi:hypothetical protein
VFKKISILVLFTLGWCINALSQQLSHQVIVPAAGLASDSKICYSQTVGETAVEIIRCTQYIFTQGFQQPALKRKGEEIHEGENIKVYPIPASDYIVVDLYGEKEKSFRIEIINIMGRVVFSLNLAFYDQYWYKEQQNIKDLIRGFYFVRVISNDGMINRTFKIEKL